MTGLNFNDRLIVVYNLDIIDDEFDNEWRIEKNE